MTGTNNKLSFLTTPFQDIRNFISNYKFDNLKIFLIILFAILYLPHCFILNEDLGITMAYETDPGMAIEAIFGLLEKYDFHEQHYSRHYGWTYYFINIILLTPFKIFIDIFGFSDGHMFLSFVVKLIFFTIGLLSLLTFHEILLKLFSSKILAAFGSLFYLIGDVFFIFYFIHPETTALLFLFMGILCLLNFIENPRYKYYIYGLIFLTASSLAKQIFFFIACPMLIAFTVVFFKNEGCSLLSFIKSEKFAKFILHSILTAFLTMLLINPFLIFDFHNAIEYQTELVNIHNQDEYFLKLLTTKELADKWILLLGSIPIIFAYFLLAPFSIAWSCHLISQHKKTNLILFLAMILMVYFTLFITISSNKLYVLSLYLVPIYPFLIIHMMVLMKYFSDIKGRLGKIFLIILGIFLFICLVKSLQICAINSYHRILHHKNSMAYMSHDYITQNLNQNDRIIHDHLVAMPLKMRPNSCNYWFNEDCLGKINPDYIIINENFKVNGKKHRRLEVILEYVKKNVKNGKIKLHHQIHDAKGKEFTISIYKHKKINEKRN